jgi:hypothetical protein
VRPIPVLLKLEGRDEPVEVFVDQRDLARAEADESGNVERPLTRNRFLAWSAAKRAGVVSCTWEKFNGHECIDATVSTSYKEETDADQVDELDPGQVDQNAGA